MFCPLVSIRVMNSGQLPLKGRSLSRHYADDPENWDPSNYRKDSKDFCRKINFDPKNNANQEFCQLEKVQLVGSNISCETIELRLTLDYNSGEKKLTKKENENVELRDKISNKIVNVIDEIKLDLEETNKNDKEKCESLKNEPDDKILVKIDEKSISQNEEKSNDEQDEKTREKNSPETKNTEDENEKLNKREYQNFPALSSLTRKKMDDLLKSLRERTNALNQHEGKTNGQFAGRARLPQRINLETGTHEKSGSLANYAVAIGPEARASFAERIQEIWLDHKSQWSVVGEKKPKIFSQLPRTSPKLSERNVDDEEIDHELEINNYEPENSAKIENKKKSKLTGTADRNFQTFHPIICHVGVQYELEEFHNQKKSSVGRFDWETKSDRSIVRKIDEFREFSQFSPPKNEEKKTMTFSDAEKNREFGKSKNPFSSFFISEDSSSGSKKNAEKSGDSLSYRGRKRLKMVIPKMRLKSFSNFHLQIPRNRQKNREEDKKLLSKKSWFFMGTKERSRMREKLLKLLAKSRTKSLKNCEKLARGLKKIFSCPIKQSAPNFDDKNEDESSREGFSGSGVCEKSIEPKSPSQIQTENGKKLSSENLPPASGCCQSSSIGHEKSSPQLEYPKKMDLATKSHGSMTNLSVTTSNSTNITLQLLGSTSATRNVPSGDSRLVLAPRLVESWSSEMLKSDRPVELAEKIEDPKVTLEISNILEENENPSKAKIDETPKSTVEKLSANKTIDRSRTKMPDLRSKRESEMKNRAMLVRKDCPTSTRTETLAKRVISSRTSSSSTEKNLRLQRRKSVIDIKVDKLTSERTKKVDVPNGQARSSRYSSRRKIDPQKCSKIGMASSSIERAGSRQRKDSPIVPRKVIGNLGSRGKSSHIPIAVEYQNFEKNKNSGDSKNRVESIFSMNFSPPSLENIFNVISTSTSEKMEKPVKIDPEKIFPSPKSSESRKFLKITPPTSPNSKSKKIDHSNRVHFELNEYFPEEKKSRELSEKKKLDERLDDAKIVKRIKSSIETGVPLKRITITEPHVVPKKRPIEKSSILKKQAKFLVPPPKDKSSSLNLSKEKTASKSFNRVDKKKLASRCYRHESPSTRQIPRQTVEKCDSNKMAISYRQFGEKHRHRSNKKSEESESIENFSKIDHFPKSERSMMVDLTSIKEKLDNDIIERTSRTSGTEDNDCAIILIKAINSSMQFSDD